MEAGGVDHIARNYFVFNWTVDHDVQIDSGKINRAARVLVGITLKAHDEAL